MDSLALVAAIFYIMVALILYSTAVWLERIDKRLKIIHLILFILGLCADSSGTLLMAIYKKTSNIDFHTVIGFSALLLMLAHTLWATTVLIRKNEVAIRNFHRFSLTVWIVWIIAFFSGAIH